MSIASLKNVLRIFSGAEPTDEERAELFKEVMMMTLARATSADTNIKDVEIEKVQQVLKDRIGDDYSAADIRVAAQSEIFESEPLDKYISASSKKLKIEDRLVVAKALVDVIHSDDRVSELEVNFFNTVVEALALTPADLMGLQS